MNSELRNERPEPESVDQTGRLTEQQQAFAKVVGRALAGEWRRKWKEVTGNPGGNSRQDERPSAQSH